MTRLKATLGFSLFAALAACQQMQQLPTIVGVRTSQPGTQVADAGACGAAEFQNLVGQSVSVLNTAELPEGRRVIFPGMAVTQEFQPDRLNVEVGSDDAIARVYCG